MISQAHNISIDQIISANPQISDPNSLQVGQQICIPTNTVTNSTGNAGTAESREILTYLYGGTSDYYLNLLSKTQNSIKTVSPDFFEISNEGNLLLASPDKLNASFIQNLHEQGIKVIPFITNHWNRTIGNISLDNRENLSNQIVSVVNQYGLDGINIDIENVTEQYRLQYTDFVRLLRQKLPSDKIISVAVAANPKGWTIGWHGSYDYKALSDYADYLMIMAYDESYQGSPEGPVASSSFLNASIQYALNQGVPQSKIVVGIPFYGRYWKVGDAIGGIGIAGVDVENLLKNYTSNSRFDDATNSAYAEVTINPGQPEPIIWGGRTLTAGTYHIWYDNEDATKYKLSTINSYNLKGVGSWTLGQEIPAIWDFYTQALNSETDTSVPQPTPAPQPTPEPVPEIPVPNNQKIINALKEAGDPRAVATTTQLTRGETAVALAKLANLSPDLSSNAPYNDISTYWGRGYINALYNKDVLKDFIGNTFSPSKTVTKEDIASMMEKILNLPSLTNLPKLSFKDLATNRWSYNAIAKLYYLNLIQGFNKNFFEPTAAMTVNDIAKIMDTANSYGYNFKS